MAIFDKQIALVFFFLPISISLKNTIFSEIFCLIALQKAHLLQEKWLLLHYCQEDREGKEEHSTSCLEKVEGEEFLHKQGDPLSFTLKLAYTFHNMTI